MWVMSVGSFLHMQQVLTTAATSWNVAACKNWLFLAKSKHRGENFFSWVMLIIYQPFLQSPKSTIQELGKNNSVFFTVKHYPCFLGMEKDSSSI